MYGSCERLRRLRDAQGSKPVIVTITPSKLNGNSLPSIPAGGSRVKHRGYPVGKRDSAPRSNLPEVANERVASVAAIRQLIRRNSMLP